MNAVWCRRMAGLCLGLGVMANTGCQTDLGGMTLPSPSYLRDHPDYIPKRPAFPLPRELAVMQGGEGAAVAPVGPAGAP